MVTPDELGEIALSLPEAHERPAWGLRCFRVRDKIFAAHRPELGGVAVKSAEEEIAALVAGNPGIFSVPGHYRNYSMVLVQLSTVDSDELRELLTESWRRTAPAKLVRAHDAAAQ